VGDGGEMWGHEIALFSQKPLYNTLNVTIRKKCGRYVEISLISSDLHHIIIIIGNNKTFPLEY